MKFNGLTGSGGVFPYWLAMGDGFPNQVMEVELRNRIKRCLGITTMDYPGTPLIKGIIESNF